MTPSNPNNQSRTPKSRQRQQRGTRGFVTIIVPAGECLVRSIPMILVNIDCSISNKCVQKIKPGNRGSPVVVLVHIYIRDEEHQEHDDTAKYFVLRMHDAHLR